MANQPRWRHTLMLSIPDRSIAVVHNLLKLQTMSYIGTLKKKLIRQTARTSSVSQAVIVG